MRGGFGSAHLLCLVPLHTTMVLCGLYSRIEGLTLTLVKDFDLSEHRGAEYTDG